MSTPSVRREQHPLTQSLLCTHNAPHVQLLPRDDRHDEPDGLRLPRIELLSEVHTPPAPDVQPAVLAHHSAVVQTLVPSVRVAQHPLVQVAPPEHMAVQTCPTPGSRAQTEGTPLLGQHSAVVVQGLPTRTEHIDVQVPAAVQDWPVGQVPHVPVHPSEPHVRPPHMGVQVVEQVPLTVLHVAGAVQAPQTPPQPSGPHARPLHVGVQHWPVTLLHELPDGHVPHEPWHPLSPHCRVPQVGAQLSTPPSLPVPQPPHAATNPVPWALQVWVPLVPPGHGQVTVMFGVHTEPPPPLPHAAARVTNTTPSVVTAERMRRSRDESLRVFIACRSSQPINDRLRFLAIGILPAEGDDIRSAATDKSEATSAC